MLKYFPAGLDADLAEYLADKDVSLLHVARDPAESTSQYLLDLDKRVESATSTLRELQRQMALLKARLSVLNSSENYPSDGAESGGSASGEDESGEAYFEQLSRTSFGPTYNGVGKDSVTKHRHSRKRMTRAIEKHSACTAATETVHRSAAAVVTDSVPRHNDGNPAPSAATESVATDSVQRQKDGRVASTLHKRLDKSLAYV